jgi:hypothetical protein
MRLETGSAQPEAIRFYRREGYRQIPLFGNYVGSEISVCFERVIPPALHPWADDPGPRGS